MWSGPKQQKFIFSVLEAGILRYGCQQVGSNGSSLQMAVFLLCAHMAERARQLSGVSFIRALIPKFHRHDLIISPEPHLLMPSHLYVCVLVAQSCPTLCDLMDCSLPSSSVHEIFQARILEWVAIPFSRGSS